ncbi:MAG: DNA replication and repair protein RecF [Microgenomates group bacterium]|nr:DNA replication and repair protein RecF [Microgenomates group bacterium]
MLLRKIFLTNFRNFKSNKFEFNPFLTIIVGENARGKTNLLEAVFFLINGTGFREIKEEELINFNEERTQVEGIFNLADQSFNFRVVVDKKSGFTEKKYFINQAKKKFYQYLKEQTKAILFSPEQIEIINGSPEKRRDYFNKQISFYDNEYKRKLLNYENALKRRNKILERQIDLEKLKEEISFWNRYLEEQGGYITQKRQSYIDFLNQNQNLDSKKFEINYLKSEINQEKLLEKFELEKKVKKTLIGPQKDDFQINIGDHEKKNIHRFGSRSEQRLAVFWLKINEIKFYESLYKKKPIILLDDIFSEFDINNKILIIDLIKKYQSVVTSTDVDLIKIAEVPKTIIKL